MKNYGKKWDVTSPAIKMKEKQVQEDMYMFTFATTGRKRSGRHKK